MIARPATGGISRRALLTRGTASLLAAASGLTLVTGRARALTEEELFPVVETEHGRVRGVDWTGIKTFKGIRKERRPGAGIASCPAAAAECLDGAVRRFRVRGFAPVVGNDLLPHHPFDPVAPPESKDGPIIVDTTLDDAGLGMTDFDMTEAELKQSIAKRNVDDADRIYEMYRDAYPEATPYLVAARIATDRGFRRSAITQAERKSAQGGAPAYYYLWEWPAPAYDGKFGAVHGVDVGFALHDYRGPITGGGNAQGKRMADRFGTVWANFAKTGEPNSDLTPKWPAYDSERRATMVFDAETRVENDYRGEFRKLWNELSTKPRPDREGG